MQMKRVAKGDSKAGVITTSARADTGKDKKSGSCDPSQSQVQVTTNWQSSFHTCWRNGYYLVEYTGWSLLYGLVCWGCFLLKCVWVPLLLSTPVAGISHALGTILELGVGPLRRSDFWRSLPSPHFLRMQQFGYLSAQFSSNHDPSSNTGTPSNPNPSSSNNLSQHAEQVLDRVKRGLRVRMDKVLDAYLSGGDSDFPSCESPVWIFGRSYSVNYDIEELRRSVSSCLWITYRKNFPTIGGTTITSDKGWGCMIRAGQMLLAKALLLRHLSDDWHWDPDCRNHHYLQIVSLFEDTKVAPLSLHQIAQSGASLGKPIGSWLGPNTVAQALKKIISSDYVSLDLTIHIAMDSTVVKSEIKYACMTPSHSAAGAVPSPPTYFVSTPRPDSKWKPLLLVVPLRLGLSDLNEAYVPGIKAALEVPQNVGIIGGRPNHALYFIGYAANEVLYLDPHTVQPSVFVSSKLTETERSADETYHIQKPGRMSFSLMDPSIAVCFLCKTESDFDAVCKKLTERFQVTPLPLFEICEGRPQDWMSVPLVMSSDGGSRSGKTHKSTYSKKSPKSSTRFTTLSLGTSPSSSTGGSHAHSISRSTGGDSPSSSVSGRSKSDIDDEDFEILG